MDRSPVERPRRTGCRTAGDARGSTQPSSPEAGPPARTAAYGSGREPGRPRAERSCSLTPLGARGSAGRSRLQRRSPPRLGAAPAPAPRLPSLTRRPPPKAVGPPSTSRSCRGPARKNVKTRRARTATRTPRLWPRLRPLLALRPQRGHSPTCHTARGAPAARVAADTADCPRGARAPGCGRSLGSGSLTNPGARGDPQRSGVFTSETLGSRGTPCGSHAEKRGCLDHASPHRVPGTLGAKRSSREHFPLQTRPHLGADQNAASSSSHASPTPTGSSGPRTWPRRRGRASVVRG